ncbi:MAG: GAF domain-containing protein, partial [Anaerolineae bacterium]|nr:GAF domain-containing protein [Anaerolineae bacterium]
MMVATETGLITLVTGLLQPLYSQLEVVPELAELLNHVPALLVIDYAVRPANPVILEDYRRAGSQILLLLPEDDEAALNYAQTPGVDDFVVLPAEARSLPYRLRKLQQQVEIPDIMELPNKFLLDRQQYEMVSALTLSHAFCHAIQPDGTLRRIMDNTESFRRVFGLSYAEMEARGGWEALIYPDDLPMTQAYRKRLQAGEAIIYDYRIWVTAEATIWIREYGQPVIENGRVVLIKGASQNVNNLKTAQQSELSRRESIKGLHYTAQVLSSNLEIDKLLDQIISSLGEMLPVDLSNVMMIKEGLLRIVRQQGYEARGLTQYVVEFKAVIKNDLVLNEMATPGKALIIHDLQQSVYAESPEAAYAGAYMGAPLYIHDQLAGFLNLYSQQPYQYKEDHLFVLEAFASQVSAALSNASFHNRLLHHSTELEQRLRDLVIVYEIGQALTATLNLSEIYMLLYQEVVEKLFQASQMQVFLFDDNQYRCDFAVNDGMSVDPLTIKLTAAEETCLQQIMQLSDPCVQSNVIYEPLMSHSQIVGVLKIVYQNTREFDVDDRTLFSIVASVAAIAIENARLYMTVNSQHNEIKALYQATASLYRTDDLQELGWLITASVVEEFNYADCGLMLFDADKKNLERIVRNGSYNLQVAGSLPASGTGLVPTAAREGQTVYAPDVSADPRYLPSELRTQSELVIPLITSRGVIGVLDLQSTELNAFTGKDRRVLQTFAESAAVAIENLQLLAKIRQHASDLEVRVAERTKELWAAWQKERELNELKSRFVMTISHQFRTPLTAIQSSKELLK